MRELSRSSVVSRIVVAALVVLVVSHASRSFADSLGEYATGWSVDNNANWTPFPPANNPLGAPNDNCVDVSAPPPTWAEFTFPAFSFPAGSTLTGIEVEVNYVNLIDGSNDVRLTNGGGQVGATRTVGG